MKISYRGWVWALAFGLICPAVWAGLVSVAGILLNVF